MGKAHCRVSGFASSAANFGFGDASAAAAPAAKPASTHVPADSVLGFSSREQNEPTASRRRAKRVQNVSSAANFGFAVDAPAPQVSHKASSRSSRGSSRASSVAGDDVASNYSASSNHSAGTNSTAHSQYSAASYHSQASTHSRASQASRTSLTPNQQADDVAASSMTPSQKQEEFVNPPRTRKLYAANTSSSAVDFFIGGDEEVHRGGKRHGGHRGTVSSGVTGAFAAAGDATADSAPAGSKRRTMRQNVSTLNSSLQDDNNCSFIEGTEKRVLGAAAHAETSQPAPAGQPPTSETLARGMMASDFRTFQGDHDDADVCHYERVDHDSIAREDRERRQRKDEQRQQRLQANMDSAQCRADAQQERVNQVEHNRIEALRKQREAYYAHTGTGQSLPEHIGSHAEAEAQAEADAAAAAAAAAVPTE